jgi:hypothetical protein
MIKQLKEDDGQYTKYRKEMGGMANTYFQHLYTADPSMCSQELLQIVELMVMKDMNVELCKEFTDKEIADALFQVGPLKAPGSDGFPAHFFQ